jgi:hypothetical protein
MVAWHQGCKATTIDHAQRAVYLYAYGGMPGLQPNSALSRRNQNDIHAPLRAIFIHCGRFQAFRRHGSGTHKRNSQPNPHC